MTAPKQPGFSSRTVYAAVVLLVALVVGLYSVYLVGQLALAFFLALLLAVVLGGPVDYLAGRGLPRTLSTLAVVGVLAGAVLLFLLSVVPDLIGQVSGLAQNLPEILEDDEGWVNRALDTLGVGDRVEFDAGGASEAVQRLRQWLLSGDVLSAVAGAGATAITVVTLGLLVVFGAIFLVSTPRPFFEGFVSLFPAGRRQRTREVLGKLYRALQAWALGQSVTMVFIGVSSSLALYLIGVPYALLMGVFGGVIAFVPYLGSILSAVPPIFVALFTNPTDVLWVVVAYVVIQQIEGDLIEPVVMSRVLKLHPVLVLFAVAVMGTLFGIMGVLLAVPATAVVRILVAELWVGRMDELGQDPNPPEREEESDPMEAVRKTLRSLRFWR